jgi:hypothetical protein
VRESLQNNTQGVAAQPASSKLSIQSAPSL